MDLYSLSGLLKGLNFQDELEPQFSHNVLSYCNLNLELEVLAVGLNFLSSLFYCKKDLTTSALERRASKSFESCFFLSSRFLAFKSLWGMRFLGFGCLPKIELSDYDSYSEEAY